MTLVKRIVLALTLGLGCNAVERVLLVRHCVRSMYPTLRGRGEAEFDFADNYTAKSFPTLQEWRSDGVGHCTEKGLEIAKAFGASLVERGVLSPPISVVSDNISRCISTANQMVSGLGSNATYVGLTKTLDPTKYGLCEDASPENKTAGVQSMIDFAKSGNSYLSAAWRDRKELMSMLQSVVGIGEAPSILDIKNKIDDQGHYVGGLYISSQAMIENFMLEAGAGISVGWGELDSKKGRELLWQELSPLNVLYNRINHNGIPKATRDGAIIVSILQSLLEKSLGSLVLVGHDTNVDNVAALLGLTWSCGPYADNESPPHIGLLFENTANGVSISVVCTAIDEGYGDVVVGTALVGKVRKDGQPMASVLNQKLMQEAHAQLEKWDGLGCAGESHQTTLLV